MPERTTLKPMDPTRQDVEMLVRLTKGCFSPLALDSQDALDEVLKVYDESHTWRFWRTLAPDIRAHPHIFEVLAAYESHPIDTSGVMAAEIAGMLAAYDAAAAGADG